MECKILFLEPFYGGSHKDFADGLVRHSRHNIELMTLPDRFWKWRMRGAALHFADMIENPSEYDLILVSDLLSLSDLTAFFGKKMPSTCLYFHENQLSYPVPKDEERDVHFGFTDITSAVSADRIMFNSHFHYDSFFNELPRFLGRMPEYRPNWVIEEIRKKSQVVYPGIELPASGRTKKEKLDAPLILWNHRWEFDKGPEVFFRTLYELDKRGLHFYLALAGENFQTVPKPFLEAKGFFGDRVLQYGYIPDKLEYQALLLQADIIISTAYQENFGISVLEAAASGCHPLLPARLSYPEILPDRYHRNCLYTSEEDLAAKLAKLLGSDPIEPPAGLSGEASRFSWADRICEFDDLFTQWFSGG
jgi:glycosyltransferase involved in cell wall biosynthesis